MDFFIEIMPILLPVIIVSGIALFVIKQMKDKQERGKLGRKEEDPL
ncbi:hypothetical protein [Sinobaca sp. H24]|nr:hypothetical protein [Sinobaca sp. H24]